MALHAPSGPPHFPRPRSAHCQATDADIFVRDRVHHLQAVLPERFEVHVFEVLVGRARDGRQFQVLRGPAVIGLARLGLVDLRAHPQEFEFGKLDFPAWEHGPIDVDSGNGYTWHRFPFVNGWGPIRAWTGGNPSGPSSSASLLLDLGQPLAGVALLVSGDCTPPP